MKIVFRLNYYTIPGQSLWLKYAILFDDRAVRIDHVIPLRWLNETQWETCVDIAGAGKFQLEANYQLRQSGNEVELDEWGPRRVTAVDPKQHAAVLLLDTWCSAGTPDYAYETKALRAASAGVRLFSELATPPLANHTFQLRMAAVAEGKVPCVIGSTAEIGDWGWHSAVPLVETAADVWGVNVYLPNEGEIEYKYGLFDTKLKCVVSLELGENRRIYPRFYAEQQWVHVQDECYRRDTSNLYRAAGVSVPVFSLRSAESLGIGEFADLKPLADWASGVGLKLIQILPINDTTSAHDWTDSYPYSAISVFALHPIYLRISELDLPMSPAVIQELATARVSLNSLEVVDYEAVMRIKIRLTREIFIENRADILASNVFIEFLEVNREWVVPYAVFCLKRDHFGTADFSLWHDWARFDRERVDALTDPANLEWLEVAYHLWLQCELDRQLTAAVEHLHQKGLVLKGDLPIGIDRQSVDAWAAPEWFKMSAQAGAPPDAFAVKGQNWGFPTYDWQAMQLDGYGWWRRRFARLSRYFDAYRIDHILGFFRIWQIPYEQVEGIMGCFDPALPISLEEIQQRGIRFDFNRYCRPYLRRDALDERFGEAVDGVIENFLHDSGDGYFHLSEKVLNQRRMVEYFAAHPQTDCICAGLMDCASEVLFMEVAGSHGTQFHPRMSLRATHSFRDLDAETRQRMGDLYDDYFYRRQEDFWQGQGYAKLPVMRRASSMLLCGEDLGMVPACVAGVLKELGILSLEIQRMPKTHEIEFYDPRSAPYLCVVSPSTHDMSTLRAWWREDPQMTARFGREMLGIDEVEAELSGEVAAKIIWQHLQSPAMWAIFPIQDLLAMDETLRHPDLEAERINIPAVIPFYWRYRMHLDLEVLAAAKPFNTRLLRMLRHANR